MMSRLSQASLLALVALPLLSLGATAQIAVSANDNKVTLVNGVNTVVANPPPDTVTILDIGVSPPKVLGEVKAGTSVVGVPQSVAIAPDESIALVTAATKIDPADAKKTADDNKLAVIDLKASPPSVIATLEVGAGPSGVSFSPDGKLVLVANRAEGTVSVLSVSGKTLSPIGKIDFGNPKSGPSHVAFTPDGKRALVTRDGDHRVSVLAVDGTKVEDTKRFMVGGYRPYSMEITADGAVAVFGNQGGGQGDDDVINVVDLQGQPAARRRHDLGRPDARRRRHVARRPSCGGHRDERLEPREEPSGLQRFRAGQGVPHRGDQAHPGRRGQGRPLVPGRGMEPGRQDPGDPVHGGKGAAVAQLRRQGAQTGRGREGERRARRHPHGRTLTRRQRRRWRAATRS
jgi:hypothetical protein